jgi:hypothetical protein
MWISLVEQKETPKKFDEVNVVNILDARVGPPPNGLQEALARGGPLRLAPDRPGINCPGSPTTPPEALAAGPGSPTTPPEALAAGPRLRRGLTRLDSTDESNDGDERNLQEAMRQSQVSHDDETTRRARRVAEYNGESIDVPDSLEQELDAAIMIPDGADSQQTHASMVAEPPSASRPRGDDDLDFDDDLSPKRSRKD